MIFQHTYQQVLDGSKTQTRRIARPTDGAALFRMAGLIVDADHYLDSPHAGRTIDGVIRGQRMLYRVNQMIAIQPGRGQQAVGRTRVTAIRLERLQDTTNEDAAAELGGVLRRWKGASNVFLPPPNSKAWLSAFADLWDTIHKKRGERWIDNPLVWALTFTLVEEWHEQTNG